MTFGPIGRASLEDISFDGRESPVLWKVTDLVKKLMKKLLREALRNID